MDWVYVLQIARQMSGLLLIAISNFLSIKINDNVWFHCMKYAKLNPKRREML